MATDNKYDRQLRLWGTGRRRRRDQRGAGAAGQCTDTYGAAVGPRAAARTATAAAVRRHDTVCALPQAPGSN